VTRIYLEEEYSWMGLVQWIEFPMEAIPPAFRICAVGLALP